MSTISFVSRAVAESMMEMAKEKAIFTKHKEDIIRELSNPDFRFKKGARCFIETKGGNDFDFEITVKVWEIEAFIDSVIENMVELFDGNADRFNRDGF